MRRPHIVLVGLPGSGKTTAGRSAAAALGVAAADIDAMIERRERRTIAEIVDSEGEAFFRSLERAAVAECLDASERSIVMPGGGWAAQPAALASVGDRGLTVFLDTAPDEAARRLEGGNDRPLLAGRDTVSAMRDLHRSRLPFYRGCDVTIPTSGMASAEVTAALIQLARSKVGW